MKKALLLGKFMPFHAGHIALIDFALTHADELQVLVCANENEIIDGSTRYHWVREYYTANPAITVHYVVYDPAVLPATSESSVAAAQKWAVYLGKHFPDTALFVSSEPYGALVAEFMGIHHLCFDEKRQQAAISATAIREQPFKHWMFIPAPVRPYFVKKIAIVGSESTGKSVLAERLARHYNTVFVPEAARDIVAATQTCTLADLYTIAAAHASAVIEKMAFANKLLFVDTDVRITRSYGTFLFNENIVTEDWVNEANRFDLYLFLETDCDFVQDGTRLEAADREKLNACHKQVFAAEGIVYHLLRGDWQQRFSAAVAIIERDLF